jgi:ABC-type Fe3+/spermidine/putrescine transport system ATPase subunit
MSAPQWLGVRPERIQIGNPVGGHFDATVKKRTYLGGTMLYELGVGDFAFSAKVATDGVSPLPDIGSVVSVSWPAHSAWPLA